MVDCKMYSTSDVSPIKQYEGFRRDYCLPQGPNERGCYAETCASIAVMMLAQRMSQYDPDGKYGDVLELYLHDNVLTAMSSDGQAFTCIDPHS